MGVCTRVVIPATADRSPYLADVRAALDGVDHEVHIVTGDDGYWRLLSDLWRRAEGVVLVEHDIIASKAAIDELVTCGGDWCCCPYSYERGEIVGLGCTKFTGALMARVPDAIERAGRITDRSHPVPGHWCRLDASIQRALRDSNAASPGAAVMCYRHSTVGHLGGRGSLHGCRK